MNNTKPTRRTNNRNSDIVSSIANQRERERERAPNVIKLNLCSALLPVPSPVLSLIPVVVFVVVAAQINKRPTGLLYASDVIYNTHTEPMNKPLVVQLATHTHTHNRYPVQCFTCIGQNELRHTGKFDSLSTSFNEH